MIQTTTGNSKDCLAPSFPALNEIFHLFDKALGRGSRMGKPRGKLGRGNISAPDAHMLAHSIHLCSVVRQHHYFPERLWVQTCGAAKNLLTLLSFGTVATETWLLIRQPRTLVREREIQATLRSDVLLRRWQCPAPQPSNSAPTNAPPRNSDTQH